MKSIPKLLSDRPTKTVLFELPFSFVMGPEQIAQIAYKESLESLLSELICLEPDVVKDRLDRVRANKLDHALLLFDADSVPVRPASIDGVRELLHALYPDVAVRFERVFSLLQALSGGHNFQARIDKFSEYWKEWRLMRDCTWIAHCDCCISSNNKAAGVYNCTCNSYSFAHYCADMDEALSSKSSNCDAEDLHQALLITRKMLFIMVGCNQYYGFDGYTYDGNGQVTGEEFLAANSKLNGNIACVFLSDVDRFQLH